jgi:hypothetical protein
MVKNPLTAEEKAKPAQHSADAPMPHSADGQKKIVLAIWGQKKTATGDLAPSTGQQSPVAVFIMRSQDHIHRM